MRIYLRLLVVSLLLFAGNIVYAEAQQEKRVTGTVTSEGEPLPGVSVQLKGASSGTITDIDGKYSIEIPATGTLVFRFVGMRTVEQPVNNRSVINVTLESESKELEEVMVVAYATAKKYSFTGAASTMKAGEIEKLQTSSISRVLEGTVSGVQASAASGQPGTDAEIRIRGIGSINASSAPLYVVDGVPFDGSVNSINPDDISSMTVLKDAASAALYGSRGANGVITDEIDPNKESDIAVHEENLMIPKGIEVYEINGPYFFGIATKFEETMTQLGDRPKVRIIRMRKVPFIDSTGIHNLTTLCEMSQKEKTTVILSGVNENVHNVLEKAGFYELLGKENICPNINVALERAKSLVK